MADDDLLQSWKEIAAYLERSERTCRRWETDFGLPVHRMEGSARSSVFAYRSELDRWMDEILREERRQQPSQPSTATRRSLFAAAVLAMLAIAVVAVMVTRHGQSEPETSANPSLAILPFTNLSGDEAQEFWENALADLLTSDLAQSRYLDVLAQDRLWTVLRDLDQPDAFGHSTINLTEIGERANVVNVVTGSFIRSGERFRINASVQDVLTGQSDVLPSVEAAGEAEILPRIDELSTTIKNHLLSPDRVSDDDPDLDVGTITTSSLEAYRHYLEGRASWGDGRVMDAMESGEKAVAIDPQFAMAHSLLVACYSSLPGYEAEAEASRERAFQSSDHASPRERFLIRGMYYMSRSRASWGRALETFADFVEAYPDDELARFRLGQLQLLLEQWDRCIENLDQIPEDSWFSSHLDLLRQAHGALGQYQTALEVAERANRGGDSFQYRHQLALNLMYEHRFEEALAQADMMLERAPGFAPALKVQGDVHLFRAEWDRAEACYRELLSPIGGEARRLYLRLDGLRRLASLYLTRGQFERALNVLDLAIHEVTALGETRWLVVLHCWRARLLLALGRLPEADAETQIVLDESARRDHVTGTTSALTYRGLIRLRQGDIPAAEEAAAELKAVLDDWLNPRLIRRWHFVAGEIDLAKGNLGDAVAHLEQAVALLPHQYEPDGDPHAPYFSALAESYFQAGDLGKAREWHENVLNLTSGRLTFGDVYATSHLRLGQILQRQGREADAIRSYRTFLDLWRDADPSRPELAQARLSLAALSD